MSVSNKQENKIFPATVIKILNDSKIAINRGSFHGIKDNQRFLVYQVEKEPLIDPDTGENLGNLEIVRGTGKAIHIQDKITTIESDNKVYNKRIIRRNNSTLNSLLHGLGGSEEEIISPSSDSILPFDSPKSGDLVKPI